MKRAGSKRPKSGVVKLGRASGRVKCFIRVRPLNDIEDEREDEHAVAVSQDNKEVLVNDNGLGLDKNFKFDHVFPQGTTNTQISNFISKPLVKAAISGFNGTVMAYGQTGSGKTYTLMSPDGVTPTIIERCFRKIAAAKENLHYKVSMSYLQIYQEKIFDLLNNATANKIDLTIREHPQKGIYVENLSEYVVRSPDEVHSLMQLGKKRLIFAETKMNRTSSRSHSVCILSIERSSKHLARPASPTKKHFDKKLHATLVSEGVDTPNKSESSLYLSDEESSESEDDDALSKMMAFNDDVVLKGHLYICDLAGSERIKKTNAEGERLSEAQRINLSLLELGNVIQALAEAAESGHHVHVPFRNSTLTRLLQESLGGNCKTSLVVCCSPSDYNVHETKCSLNFGSRAMKVRNTAYINVEMDYKKLSDDLAKLLDTREKEIEELKDSHQHQLDLSKKEAEMAAELKFGDGMNEARNAYMSLKHLLDSQASSHAEAMSKLQAELSKEKDARLALQAELDRKGHSSSAERNSKTKCLLLAEVLSMQLFYTLQSRAASSNDTVFDEEEKGRQDVEETQEEILENVDNLIGVLGSYLNLTEKEFAEANDDEFFNMDEDELYLSDDNKEPDGPILELQSLVLKIRKRLSLLKDSVDGRALRFLNGVIERKDRTSMEDMAGVYQVLENLLTARKEASDHEFLDNSKDAERCLTYVLLDKALLCCLVVLDRFKSETKLVEIEERNEELVTEIKLVRGRNKSLNNDNDRLISQLEHRHSEHQLIIDEKTKLTPDPKAFETLLKHNAKLKLEIEHLKKGHGHKTGEPGEELAFLRQQVTQLTRENEKLEFMMKMMGERFSQGESEQPRFTTKPKKETKSRRGAARKLELAKVVATSTSAAPAVRRNSAEQKTEVTEKILTSTTTKTGSHRVQKVKRKSVDETFEYLDDKISSSTCGTNTEPAAEKGKLTQLLDNAIESVQYVGINTDLMLNSSLEDIEALEKDLSAMKENNEALGKQCLSLVNDKNTLESLLSDLRGNIAGLQEKVTLEDQTDPVHFSLPDFDRPRSDDVTEYVTEVYRTTTGGGSGHKPTKDDIKIHKVNVHTWESESVKKTTKTREFLERSCQTDVTCIANNETDSENDSLEDGIELAKDLKGSDVVQRLVKKYCMVKHLVKHLESEIRMFKVRTTALETELKERQHLKDENMLLEEEVKELQGLKIYLESQLVEAGGELGDLGPSESNLSKWKSYEEEDSFSDCSGRLSASTMNLSTSTPSGKQYGRFGPPGISQSMMELSEPQMYSSFSSLRSSRGSFGSLKMLKLEMEGQPSRIRDKLKSASLLLQHTGSLESQLRVTRQKCFRLEGEVCKLVKEKKELSDELDNERAKFVAKEAEKVEAEVMDLKIGDETTKKRRSFRFKRGKEKEERLRNELSLAKEELSKLKSKLATPDEDDGSPERRVPRYSLLSDDEKRREKELALTRERCLILAEELGASNKEKIKLGDDLQEALDNIDVLASEVRRLELVEEERGRLKERVAELEERFVNGMKEEEDQAKIEKDVRNLKTDISGLMEEKSRLEELVSELRWEKERLNEMDNIVKRLVQAEKEKGSIETTHEKVGDITSARELVRLRTENQQLRHEVEMFKQYVSDLETELQKNSKISSLTQVLSAVKDHCHEGKPEPRSPPGRMDPTTVSRGGNRRTVSRSHRRGEPGSSDVEKVSLV